MKTALIAGAAALLLAAAPASAHKPKHAKVSTAKLEATAAATAAGIPDARGRAQLVDGRKRDKVSLHMKGLAPGETYLWHVHQATGEGDPCAAGSTVANPAPYPGWTYRELTARESGNASSKGRSTTFPSEDGEGDFYVNVHLEDGTVVACGVLERKRHKHHGGHHKGHDDGPGHHRGRGHDRDDD
jgi:hypothetical protein